MKSEVSIGPKKIPFPIWTGERIYMEEISKGLPPTLNRWESTVEAMLAGIKPKKKIYLMVDQAKVVVGNAHRRPGIHIDGYWDDTLEAHEHRTDRHRFEFKDDLLVLTSNEVGCKAYIGEYEGIPKPGGDMSHIDVSGLREVYMAPNLAYIGKACRMLHESIPVEKNCYRTVVRLNVQQ